MIQEVKKMHIHDCQNNSYCRYTYDCQRTSKHRSKNDSYIIAKTLFFFPGWVDEDRKLHGGIHWSRRWWLETTPFLVRRKKKDIPQIAKWNKCFGCKQMYKLWVTLLSAFLSVCEYTRDLSPSLQVPECTPVHLPTPVPPSESVS